MGSMQITAKCSYCQQRRPFQKPTPSHVLHLILSLVTCGLWVPLWILAAFANAFVPFRCQFCGERKLR
jgi:hypothetical protein